MSIANADHDDLDWRGQARCAGRNVDLFFPEKGESPDDALRLCQACPVTSLCLAEHLMEPRGVFGGLTAKQRQKLRVRTGASVSKRPVGQRRPPTARPTCGTKLAYDRHLREGEKPCRPCMDAKNEYRRRIREAKKAAA